MLSIWVNYNDLTATSLEIMVNKGNHPKMALFQVSEILQFTQIHVLYTYNAPTMSKSCHIRRPPQVTRWPLNFAATTAPECWPWMSPPRPTRWFFRPGKHRKKAIDGHRNSGFTH